MRDEENEKTTDDLKHASWALKGNWEDERRWGRFVEKFAHVWLKLNIESRDLSLSANEISKSESTLNR